MKRRYHWFGATSEYGYGTTISFGSLPTLISKVEDFIGECAPVIVFQALNERHPTGFFRKVKRVKVLGIEFKIRTGEEFHGFVTDQREVLSTKGMMHA